MGRVPVVRVPLDTLDEQAQEEYWKNKAAAAAREQLSHTPSANAQPQKDAPKTKTKKQQRKQRRRRKRNANRIHGRPRTVAAADREHCDHAWINADEGAGTVVKSTGKMYWAHKASTLGFAHQEVLLDAVALNDAASHDSQSLVPHLSRLLSRHPDLKGIVTRVLDDGAADDPELKSEIKTTFGIELLAPINPRRRGPIRDDLPRGIDHLTPRGVPVCQAGFPFELLGFRQETERFIFTAPETTPGESVCLGCAFRGDCYRGESGGRRVTIAADRVAVAGPGLSAAFESFWQGDGTSHGNRADSQVDEVRPRRRPLNETRHRVVSSPSGQDAAGDACVVSPRRLSDGFARRIRVRFRTPE